MWEMVMRLLGALVSTSMALSLPLAMILPAMERLVTLCSASAPPRAVTYLLRMSSAVTWGPPAGAIGRASALAGAASEEITGGTATGRAEPRWQEKQLT